MSSRIGILYICTGRYIFFWKDFYESCEKHFLPDKNFKKEYFIFTDSDHVDYEESPRVNKIYQKPLKWPYITLFRFKIFNKHKDLFKKMDYLYFFNANMLFVSKIGPEILPKGEKKFSFLQHAGFYDNPPEKFTYERNMKSFAGIETDEGKYYFQGALNGGFKNNYLEMTNMLEQNIDNDLQNNIVAIWHDESHLNRFAIDNIDKIKVLNPSYGYPEGWELPFEPKVIIRNKNKFGGHDYLRNTGTIWQKVKRRMRFWL